MKIKLKVQLLANALLLTGCFASNSDVDSVVSTEPTSNSRTELVSDEFGSYRREMVSQVEVTWDSRESGLDENEATELESWITNFIMTEALDSIALDNPLAWDKWKTEVAPEYLHSKYLKKLLNKDGYLIIADGKDQSIDLMPRLARNGKQRLATKQIISARILDDPLETDRWYVLVEGSFSAKVLDEHFVAWKVNNILGLDEAGREFYAERDPALATEEPEEIESNFSIKYMVTKENSKWKIIGFDNIFSISRVL